MIEVKNEFTSYEFTDAELLEAAKLTILQRALIQHQKGIIALEKVNMKLDPQKVFEFTQNEAHLAGQLGAYDFILSMSDWSEEAIREGLKEVQNQARERSSGNIYQPKPDPNKLGV